MPDPHRVPLVTYGKSSHQAEAIIGDAMASVVDYVRDAGKPIVIERLNFRQEKATLEGEFRKYNRMLSSFSYGKIKACLLSRGYRHGVHVALTGELTVDTVADLIDLDYAFDRALNIYSARQPQKRMPF